MWETSEGVCQLPALAAGCHSGAPARNGETGARMLRLRRAALSPVAGASLLRALGTPSRPANPLQGTSRMWEGHRVPRLSPSGRRVPTRLPFISPTVHGRSRVRHDGKIAKPGAPATLGPRPSSSSPSSTVSASSPTPTIPSPPVAHCWRHPCFAAWIARK